jgi:SAM-dependent methyltransferase
MDVTPYNRKAWDAVAEKGDELYRAMTPQQIEDARQGNWRIRITPTKAVPRSWIEPVAGKHVLCLAGGGGQQAPILAALGAKVTVLDLSEKQLERDRAIAASHGLAIETFQGDMAALDMFEAEQFDFVLNPCSVIFCEAVKPIWREVFRVLTPGGRFAAGFINPLWYVFDAAKMDKGKLKARHKIPYSDLQLSKSKRARLIGPDRPLEFGHTLTDLIGGQLDAGFQLVGFYEDRWGDDDKLSELIDVFIATCAMKLK